MKDKKDKDWIFFFKGEMKWPWCYGLAMAEITLQIVTFCEPLPSAGVNYWPDRFVKPK